MSTRELARTVGALEVIHTDSNPRDKQPFDYLLVLDFEATCWNKRNFKTPPSEIIEFPVVLYDVKNNKIVDEFQQYVKPTEQPILSDLCTDLTGIQQSQVDNGILLPTCLQLFDKFLNEKKNLYNMEFPSGPNKAEKTCAFATWSSWDLGICLKKECNRKHLTYNRAFRKWIDVKHLFQLNFKPFCGLKGAMVQLGLTFEGNEHCGLHDARNTARLVGKMIEKGVILQLTEC